MPIRLCLLMGILSWICPVIVHAQNVGPSQSTRVATRPATRGQFYTLQYKFRPNETLRWKVKHEVKFDTTVSKHHQRASTDSESVKQWIVKEVNPQGMSTVETRVEYVLMEQELTGRSPIVYDSRKDEAVPSGFEGVAASIGVPLSVLQVDPQGNLLEREIKQKSPGMTDDNHQEVTAALPEKPVQVGDHWTKPYPIVVQTDDNKIKRLKGRNYYQLVAVEDGIARIRMETQILTPVSDPALEVKLIQQYGKGQIWFDIALGHIIRTEMNVDKEVVGFRGPASSVHYKSKFSETLLRGQPRTANRR